MYNVVKILLLAFFFFFVPQKQSLEALVMNSSVFVFHNNSAIILTARLFNRYILVKTTLGCLGVKYMYLPQIHMGWKPWSVIL